MKCPKCGADINEGEAFCGSCGAKIEQQEVVKKEEKKPEVKKTEGIIAKFLTREFFEKNKLVIICVGVVVICICALLIMEKNEDKINEWDSAITQKNAEELQNNLNAVKENFKVFGDAVNEAFGISDKLEKLKQTIKDIEVKQTEKGYLLSIQNIGFKPNSDELVEADKARIVEIGEMLKQMEGCKFLVVGHTADDGTDTSGDIELSLNRAKTVISEFTKLGIDSKCFMASGAGCSEPIADNSTEEGRAQNRRVEITILKD